MKKMLIIGVNTYMEPFVKMHLELTLSHILVLKG